MISLESILLIGSILVLVSIVVSKLSDNLGVPALLLFGCFVLLRWYPLAGAAWEKIKRELAAGHEAKERSYLAVSRPDAIPTP